MSTFLSMLLRKTKKPARFCNYPARRSIMRGSTLTCTRKEGSQKGKSYGISVVQIISMYILQVIDVFSGRWLDIKFAFNGCNANVQPQRERVSIFFQILDNLIDSTFESAFCSSRSAQFHELSKFLDVSWRWRNCLGKIPIEEMRNSITFISFQMSHGQFPFRVLVRELKYAGIWIPEELRFHDSIHLMEGNKWFFPSLKN